MAKFKYKGESHDGTKVTEVVDAQDRFAVYDIARTNGHTVFEVTEVTRGASLSFLNMDRINSLLSRVKSDELVMMTRNFSSMLGAGLPLSRAISVIERQTKNPRMKTIMKDVREHINKGDQLYQALSKYPKTFSKLYVSMVRAGEESGSLTEALAVISLQLERSSNLTKKIKGAMIYPCIVLLVMVIIGVLMMIYVLPTITATFVGLGVKLPLTTQILINTSTFLVEHTILAIGAMIASVVGVISAAKTYTGKRVIHYVLIRIPVLGGLVRETNAARTARTLSSLLSAGVDVINALKITEDVVQNLYYKRIIASASKGVERGEPLSNEFIANDKLYPILVGEMILVGEETGQIAKMLLELADYYEEEIEHKTKDLSTIIEPLLMVVIGGVVGFFALAIIAPIYSISDNIK